MADRRAIHPPDSAPPVVSAGQPIPEYLLRSLPELRALPDRAAFLAWQQACSKQTRRGCRRIIGELRKLRLRIGRSSVRRILKDED